MKIEKLEIKGFGRFQNETFVPGPGMNMFYGFNEAGKTTLLSFIRAMFFGMKGGRRGRDGSASQARRYRPWNGKSFGGILEYTLDDGRKFIVGRNFEKNTVYIQDEFSNNITGSFPAGKDQDASFAEQHLGVPESGFERTAFIGQLQTPVNAEGRKILAERLLNLRESADEEISLRRAIKILREAQLSQVGSDRTTTRPLNLVEARLQDAIREEKELNRLHENRMELVAELDRLKEKGLQLNTRLGSALSAKETLLACTKAAQQRETYEQLVQCRQQLTAVIRERKKHEAAVAELQSELDGLAYYRSISHQDVNELSADYVRYCLFEKELEDLRLKKAENSERYAEAQATLRQYALFEAEKDTIDHTLKQLLQDDKSTVTGSKKPAGRQKQVAAIVFLIGMVLMAGVFLIRASIPVPVSTAFFIAGIACLGISLVCALSGKKGETKSRTESRGSSTEECRKRMLDWMQAVQADDLKEFTRLKALYDNSRQIAGELEEENAHLERKAIWVQTQLEEIKFKILSLLHRGENNEGSGILTQERIDAWKENFEAYQVLLPALQEAQRTLESCIHRQEGVFREASLIYKESITSEQELDDTLRKIAMELEQLQGGTLQQDISVEEMDETIKAIEDEIRRNQLAINTLETRFDNIPDTEALQQAHERVEALLAERDELVFLGKAYEKAIQALEEAGLTIQRDYVPALNRGMSGILSAVTGGKYSVLTADDSLALKLRPVESTEEVLPDQLSSGTIDQIYFALRLAAVRLIEKKGETLPLFLDEPFAQYDEERTRAALSLLAEESRTRQVMLFTCKEREIQLAAELFKDMPLRIINLNEAKGGR